MNKQNNLSTILTYVSYLMLLMLTFFVNGFGNKNNVAIIIGSAVSVLTVSALVFIIPEGFNEKKSSLLKIKIITLGYAYYVVQLIFSIAFVLCSYFFSFPTEAIIITDVLLFAVTILLMIIKPSENKEETFEPKVNKYEKDELKPFINYLNGLAEKSDNDDLSDALLRLSDVFSIIDPTLSQGIEALTTETGSTCVRAESAITAKDGIKQALLAKDVNDLIIKVENRFEKYNLVRTDETFSTPNNEIAEMHIDKILDQAELEEEEDIVSLERAIDDDIRFIIAKKLADDEYRGTLEEYADTIKENIKRKEQEESDRIVTAERRLVNFNISGLIASICAIIVIFVLWAFVVAPGGFSYRESTNSNGEKYITVTGYNTIYGNDVKVPSKIHGKAVKTIGTDCFSYKDSIKSITIPEGVETIENEAMKNIYSLQYVYLPKSIRTIGYFSMHKNNKESYLVKIFYAGSEEEFNLIDINHNGNSALIGGTNPANVTFDYQY